ncbi:MAG TPA: hypothetical protein VEQ16_06770, partial [Acidocella sp.]|nr:hypothetical protein [Acidocella sp.]
MRKFICSYRGVILLGFACSLGVAPAAAQTATGSMVPVPAGSTGTAPATKHASKLPKSEEFTSAEAAAAHCPNSVVVWSSLGSTHSFHLSGSRYYGKTKHG